MLIDGIGIVTMVLGTLGFVDAGVIACWRRRVGSFSCPRCDYELARHWPQTCPECGHVVGNRRSLPKDQRVGVRAGLGLLLVVAGVGILARGALLRAGIDVAPAGVLLWIDDDVAGQSAIAEELRHRRWNSRIGWNAWRTASHRDFHRRMNGNAILQARECWPRGVPLVVRLSDEAIAANLTATFQRHYDVQDARGQSIPRVDNDYFVTDVAPDDASRLRVRVMEDFRRIEMGAPPDVRVVDDIEVPLQVLAVETVDECMRPKGGEDIDRMIRDAIRFTVHESPPFLVLWVSVEYGADLGMTIAGTLTLRIGEERVSVGRVWLAQDRRHESDYERATMLIGDDSELNDRILRAYQDGSLTVHFASEPLLALHDFEGTAYWDGAITFDQDAIAAPLLDLNPGPSK